VNGLTIQLLLLSTTLIMLLMSLVIAAVLPGIDRWSKRFFIAFFTVLLLYWGVDLAEVIVEGRPDMGVALGILYYIDSLFSSIMVPMLTAYYNGPRESDHDRQLNGEHGIITQKETIP